MNHQTLRLPQEYCTQSRTASYFDTGAAFVYQPHVYELCGFLAERANARYIIDIGCGAATKLKAFADRRELVCLDNAETISLARQQVPQAKFVEWDLETGLPQNLCELLPDAIVVCSDVIEHLHNPEMLARHLAMWAKRSPFVLLSTPDRARSRGLLDDGPPLNAAHVREWTADEFGRFMRDCGFGGRFLIGHTINTDFHYAKTTTLAIAGSCVDLTSSSTNFDVAAIMHVFNEGDILEESVNHLNANGVKVHIFDNWSTDGSYELALKLQSIGLCANVQRFPSRPSTEYEWALQLSHTTEYASSLSAQWVMHHDADELRYAPWPSVRISDALAHVDALGYNCVDFTVLDFRFLRASPSMAAPFESSLNWFEFGRRPGHFRQVKAWKNGYAVDLVASGGHDALFPGRKIFPLKFLMKHYPLRSRAQAERKVFADRLPRSQREQLERGWHTQYGQFSGSTEIKGWSTDGLLPWHSRYFESEYLVERLSGIGLQKEWGEST